MEHTRTSLLAWQWESYRRAHQSRKNLAVHALTNPLFLGGGVALVTGLALLHPWIAIAGALAMPLAMAAQGWGHKQEREAPQPFRGPLDVIARIFAEQWVTFPRFVLSGAFARAWRDAE